MNGFEAMMRIVDIVQEIKELRVKATQSYYGAYYDEVEQYEREIQSLVNERHELERRLSEVLV